MKFTIVIIVLLGLFSAIYGQNSTAFCNSTPPGLYCNSNLTGYYWCFAEPSYADSAFFACQPGTQCLCFDGPSCQNVPTVGNFAPCGYHPVLPTFPASYISTQDVVILVRAPACTFTTHANRTVWVNANQSLVRIDTESSDTNSCTADNSTVDNSTASNSTANNSTANNSTSNNNSTANNSSISIQEYFVLSNDSTVKHYTYDVINQSCTASSGPGPLPELGVPAGYQFLRSETFDNKSVDVYYFINGLRIPQELYGVLDFLYVSKTNSTGGPNNTTLAIPVFENRIDYAFRVNTVTNTTTTSFLTEEPGLEVFALPTPCQNL